jgi:hypothetical protein
VERITGIQLPLFGFKSSPSFREKLAERGEAMPLGKALFHRKLFNNLIICTIKIRLEMPP